MHTHTSRCGHAVGTDEEYVKAAIKVGIKTLGFSDHVMFEGIIQDHTRGRYEQLDNYIESILALRKKYKKQIDIKLGFEVEYSEKFYGYYRYLLEEKGFNYLILGQHCSFDIDQEYHYENKNENDLSGSILYKNDLIKGMETGLFLYVCHPDLFMLRVKKPSKELEEICKEICEASIRLNVPLELNLYGFQKSKNLTKIMDHYAYPNDFFWNIAGKMGVKCVLGIDAHDPKQIENLDLSFAEQFVKKHNLQMIDDITTINTNVKD